MGEVRVKSVHEGAGRQSCHAREHGGSNAEMLSGPLLMRPRCFGLTGWNSPQKVLCLQTGVISMWQGWDCFEALGTCCAPKSHHVSLIHTLTCPPCIDESFLLPSP